MDKELITESERHYTIILRNTYELISTYEYVNGNKGRILVTNIIPWFVILTLEPSSKRLSSVILDEDASS